MRRRFSLLGGSEVSVQAGNFPFRRLGGFFSSWAASSLLLSHRDHPIVVVVVESERIAYEETVTTLLESSS